MQIRTATEFDRERIFATVVSAFGRDGEARLVDQLNLDGVTEVALVALEDDALVGHVLLSRMQAPFPALGLAPVSVYPDRQGQGVGSALIKEAIRLARLSDAVAIFVLGNQAYYGRFGFDLAQASGFTCRYSGPHFAVLPLKSPLPTLIGDVSYADAFNG